MADDVIASSTDGLGAKFATDDDGTRHWPYTKIAWGADNTYTRVSTGADAVPIQDGGNAITVDNGGTFAVQAAQSGTWNVTNISGTVSLPTGASTAANQTTANAHLSAAQVSLASIDSAVNGTLTVGSHAVTNAGTFAVQVDGAALTALQLIDDAVIAVDTAVGSTKTLLGGAIRDDALSTLTPVEGDATYLRVDANGALWVVATAGDAQLVDDAAFTPASSSVVMVGFEYDDTTPDSVDEGDAGAARMSARREIYTQIRDAAGNERGVNVDASNRLTVVADLGATDNAVLDSIDAAVNGTLTVGSHAVTNAGTFAVQVDGAALTALQLIDDPVFADDTSFALASSKVMMSGAIRDDALSTLTAIEGDAVPLRVSSTGALHVTGGGGGTEYAVDDALGATPTGTVPLAIRDDALSALTPVEGDAIALRVDSTGALWITTDDTLNVTETNSTAILADTANMDTNLGTIAGAVAAGQMQVDIVADGADLLTNTTFNAAFGTAGTADSQVMSIQGIASMTPVTVTATNLDVQSGGADLATSAQGAAIQTAVELIDNAVSGAGFNITQMNGVNVTMGNGISGTGVQRVTLASDSTGQVTANAGTNLNTSALALETGGNLASAVTALQIIDDWDETNRCAVNPISGQAGVAGGSGTVGATTQRVVLATDVALPAGTNAIGKLAANTGVDIGDVDVTSISAGANLIGDVGISGARTSGGTSFHSSLGTSTLTQIKATAGQLYWLSVINLKASVLYLQIFNKASASVTLGTTTPDLVFPIPTQGDTNGAGFNFSVPNGIAFGTGISWAITTTETGATAASDNEAYLNAGYA